MTGEFAVVKDFAIIMAVAGGALLLFRRFNLPPILGYLVAGVIVGPFTLPNPPIQDVETVRLLADLGLILLLFALGIELGWERIRQVGVRVVLIGAIEITFMMALGYEVGLLLGWSGQEAIFLGAALSISSSAVLIKMLRDTGTLMGMRGRLVVGILVVEDFAAVVLLSVLSGVATTETFQAADVAWLLGKLGIFTVATLVIGGLLTPRLVELSARYRSREALLIVSLALCFGLAMVAQELGLSAAAGAFLIGTVLGDTKYSGELLYIIVPVRDMFSALFFVSIGMLVNFSTIGEFIVPALIVAAVFIVGKMVADTMGTFVAGHDGRTSLQVGMSMPQMGEFSLAMVKVGRDYGAIGSFLYPIVTVTTAITSFVYPFLFRLADSTASLLERRSPRLLHDYVKNLSLWFIAMRTAFDFQSDAAKRVQQSGQVILLNVGIVIVLIAVGTFLSHITNELADLVGLRESIVGLIIGSGVVVLCIPSAIALWKELRSLADGLTGFVFAQGSADSGIWSRENLRAVVRDSLLAAVTSLLVIVSIPFLTELLSIGQFAIWIPIILLAGVAFVAGQAAFKIHGAMEASFGRTFLGPAEAEAQGGETVAQEKDPSDPEDESGEHTAEGW